MTVTADALDLFAGDPPRTRQRSPERRCPVWLDELEPTRGDITTEIIGECSLLLCARRTGTSHD